jgi:hypothetical protein
LWNLNDKGSYVHEIGHFIGLADRYLELFHKASMLPGFENDKDKKYSANVGNTDPYELMGKNARDTKSKITKQDINALAEYALKNQKDRKGYIKNGEVNIPTPEDIFNVKKYLMLTR